ncbi:UNVERIFIED_CONTAM: hypothetical protein FKN15_010306 [Acipenser sinensis]
MSHGSQYGIHPDQRLLPGSSLGLPPTGAEDLQSQIQKWRSLLKRKTGQTGSEFTSWKEESSKCHSVDFLSRSLITHGFGTPAICAALSTFQTVLSEMLNYLEKHSTNKNGGTPDTNQINSNSEKTPFRKTSETQSKDGKNEKTE